MAQEIEIEFKNLLTKEEYNHLLQALRFPETGTIQENFYFETEDFRLSKHGSALRIREKKDTFTLTLKEPHHQGEGLLETHDELTANEASAWFSGNIISKEHTGTQLDKLNVAAEDLLYFGSLITERRTIHFENTLLVLDCSQYNNQTDYELELEAQNYAEGKTVFHNLLEKYKIPQRKTPNKIERFFQSLPE